MNMGRHGRKGEPGAGRSGGGALTQPPGSLGHCSIGANGRRSVLPDTHADIPFVARHRKPGIGRLTRCLAGSASLLLLMRKLRNSQVTRNGPREGRHLETHGPGTGRPCRSWEGLFGDIVREHGRPAWPPAGVGSRSRVQPPLLFGAGASSLRPDARGRRTGVQHSMSLLQPEI